MSLLQTFSQLGKHKKTESESKVKECDEVKEAKFEDRKKHVFEQFLGEKIGLGP